MKSRQNPFPPASTGRRAHPSRKQSLTKKEKETTLSPDRLSHRSRVHLHSRSQGEQQLYNDDGHFSASDGLPVFTDIWPSTHCEFSPGRSTASPEMEATKQSMRSERLKVSSEAQEDSVLAKYIDRFRHGQPQSREERQQVAFTNGEEQVPFWWITHSAMGKDAHNYSPVGRHRHDRSLSVLSDTSQGEFEDTEILQLQDRANRLLLRGECSPSDGSVPVSSDGLGCSNFSSPVSVDEPVRQHVTPSLIQSFAAKDSSDSNRAVSSQKSVIPTLGPSTRPEEDILFQWRLRRKMEQAREWPQTLQHSSIHGSAFSWQTPSLNHPSTSGQPCKFSQSDAAPQAETTEAKIMYPPAPSPQPFPAYVLSGSSVSQPQALANVPAHMHLLCDVLPCPIQPSRSEGEKNISQRLDESKSTVIHKKVQVPDDGPFGAHQSSSPYASCETTEREEHSHQKVPEKTKKKRAESKEPEKKMALSTRQQRKSARGSSDQGLPKKVTPWKEHHLLEEVQEFTSKSCSVDHEPPPSPVHTALGQVVSDVLFPAVGSSPGQKIPVSLVTPPLTVSSQSPVPQCDVQNSLKVISQLLQETEDSDEKEFEDDPLLQVLRQKRKWVKDQISEVDTILSEFHKEQQVT
ncbi:proline and serine-rich protein 3 [Melanotaenia boesemani]|uniref:proline and serine-rich protein 3 n=1 Tax=Melanotaenia boesemani TaxID=1250792 RepID=UPI001C05EA39|nr:proline and serine-rich protein 3 [Melanotaenia boesemani]XP_041844214.1 proline and serine-rich protein 3 [Melanotaenia boesemani]